MNLLAIDTACSILSVALCKNKEIFYTELESGMKHSEHIMVFIDELFQKADLLPQDIDGVLCMGGPGSFTGLRIGYSIAKGLALSLSKPFYPVPTLDCIAFPFIDQPCFVVPVIQARKDAFFLTIFENGKRLIPDTDASLKELEETIRQYSKPDEKIIRTGPGSGENKGYARELIAFAKANNVFSEDCSIFLNSGPEYIRKTDAEISLLEKDFARRHGEHGDTEKNF